MLGTAFRPPISICDIKAKTTPPPTCIQSLESGVEDPSFYRVGGWVDGRVVFARTPHEGSAVKKGFSDLRAVLRKRMHLVVLVYAKNSATTAPC